MAAKDNLAYEERQGNRKGWREEVCVTDKRLVKVEFQSNYKPKPTHSIRSIKKKKKKIVYLPILKPWRLVRWFGLSTGFQCRADAAETCCPHSKNMGDVITQALQPLLLSLLYTLKVALKLDHVTRPQQLQNRQADFFYRVDRIVLNRDGSTYRPS